ncbi:complement resistance protein TraT [Thalassospiraceae bacterium LMO-JJ14]|nr:complement resistance protein TraT [Thalassospiraceae bacterium LMO-JJ14]
MTLPRFLLMCALLISPMLSGCIGAPTTRMGMVKQEDGSGLMIGSTIERNIVTDASFHKNKKIKVRIRNTSGDTAFDLHRFRSQIERAYRNIGFEPTAEDDFGILIDVNVQYSGQIQTNMSAEYGFLGGVSGGLAGASIGTTRTDAGIGAVSGAALGSIIGSFVTDDTYIIVTNVTVATIRDRTTSKPSKTVTFSRSRQTDEEKEEDQNRSKRGLKHSVQTGVAVYAGGRNTSQSEISSIVSERIARIVGNII